MTLPVQVVAMLDKAYFNAEEYQEGGWVDELKYEWELYTELQKLQKVKEDEDLKQVRYRPEKSDARCAQSWTRRLVCWSVPSMQ